MTSCPSTTGGWSTVHLRPQLAGSILLHALHAQLALIWRQLPAAADWHCPRPSAAGYPTPSLGRDAALAAALPWLKERGIWSRGRFGAYKARTRL